MFKSNRWDLTSFVGKWFIALMAACVLFGVVTVVSIRHCHKQIREVRDEQLRYELWRVGFALRLLHLIREKQYEKVKTALETDLVTSVNLLDTLNEETARRRGAEVKEAFQAISEYCERYAVFEGATNLPSHVVARRTLSKALSGKGITH